MARISYIRTSTGSIFDTQNPDFYKSSEGYEVLSQKAGKAAYAEQCRTTLRDIIKPGDTVHTILRHVSSSGMSRRIDLFIVKDDQPICISALAAGAAGFTLSDKQGISVGGCGMDMGFHLVYVLGSALWPTGTPEPHGTRNGQPDTAGGYALKQRWL